MLQYSGRIIKFTGDGFLAEFPSVQDAVASAIEIQDQLTDSELRFRMGVHLGDVMDDGNDIHGEGVNIAARIEALAVPGAVCISGAVYEQVRNRLECNFEYLGEHEVKHVTAPVRIYQLGGEVERGPTNRPVEASPASEVDRPSIAVLPFDNLSSHQDDEFFADGISEDLITALSRFRALLVIARGSSFAFKGRTADPKENCRYTGRSIRTRRERPQGW